LDDSGFAQDRPANPGYFIAALADTGRKGVLDCCILSSFSHPAAVQQMVDVAGCTHLQALGDPLDGHCRFPSQPLRHNDFHRIAFGPPSIFRCWTLPIILILVLVLEFILVTCHPSLVTTPPSVLKNPLVKIGVKTFVASLL
jgi:hypothetical protein